MIFKKDTNAISIDTEGNTISLPLSLPSESNPDGLEANGRINNGNAIEEDAENLERRQAQRQEQRLLKDRSSLRASIRYESCVVIYDTHISVTFQEAMKGPDRESWSQAIKDELKAHENNKTSEIVLKATNQPMMGFKL